MKKLIIIGMTVVSLGVFASENVIIDKEVTGVNKEQLENYKGDNNILINKNVESVNDDNIKSNNYQRQKQIIRLENVDDSVNESLMNKKDNSSIWKYIIGAIALVTLGIAL